MIVLPPRRAPKRRQVEQEDVVTPILVALNSIPGVWAAQNKVKHLPLATGAWVRTGLGIGSADVIFSIIGARIPGVRSNWSDCDIHAVARIGWLECKDPKKRTKTKAGAARDGHQLSWADAMRAKGHFVAHGVTSVAEAMAALERCRDGRRA